MSALRCETVAEFAEFATRRDPERRDALESSLLAHLHVPGTTGFVLFECVDLNSPHLGEQHIVRCGTMGDLNFARPQDAEGMTYGHWSFVFRAYYEVQTPEQRAFGPLFDAVKRARDAQ